ncbi:non-ribosomal peptide synthetase [Actinosynnema sp. NPDC050436]|uniref:non-ribosomal peptide synthetase n=1 Tax=Actinosynnema sp. NPDC050436 TaxID=3155659 RepID=UPI0033C61562
MLLHGSVRDSGLWGGVFLALDSAPEHLARVRSLTLVAASAGGHEWPPSPELDACVEADRGSDAARLAALELALWTPLGDRAPSYPAIEAMVTDNAGVRAAVEKGHARFPEQDAVDHLVRVARHPRRGSCGPKRRSRPDSRSGVREVCPGLQSSAAPVADAHTTGGSVRDLSTTPVHVLIGERTAAAPDALAVSDGARSLTYRELDRASAGLAGRLHAAGARAGGAVGVVLPRGADLVVAQLAALRLGAAIVPLDPVNPPARLALMLERADPAVVVTGPDHADLPYPTIAVDGPPAPPVGPAAPVHPDQLAYVTYTSGSTGTPKGVMSTHRSLAATVDWSRRLLALTPADRVGMTASPGFDVSVLDTLAALASGASVHAPDAALLSSPADLREWLLAERITTCFLPTPVGATALALRWPADCALRVLHVGGAALHRHPDPGLPFEVLNLYGLTEVGVWSTWSRLRPGGDGVPPIGRPVDGAEVHVLDDRMRPAPVGEVGEVHLGGVGTARGYLGEPGLTADRFVPHPWAAGARLYRTGDRARWRPDGELDFVGRTDHQVQGSGGVRIEPGEVEAALVAHPGVDQAVVTAPDGRLVAHVTGNPDVEALRGHLAARLPRYMLPDEYVVLDRLPLTATGKVDRSALPDAARRAASAPYEPPGTDLQRQLVGIWQTVLGLDRVGIHDSFFDIGGNSMSLVQVYGHLVQVASRDVTLVELYEFPTIAAFSRHLEAGLPRAVAPTPTRPDRAGVARRRRSRIEGSGD